MERSEDHITAVLRECEERLRGLAAEGRLSEQALAAFIELAGTVAREVDRRYGVDRRRHRRDTSDRRAAPGAERTRGVLVPTR